MSNEVVVTRLLDSRHRSRDADGIRRRGSRGIPSASHRPSKVVTIGPKEMVRRAMDIVRPVLIDKVERDHWQPNEAFVRRRIVVGITLAVGATLLGLSFSVRQGGPAFYPLTFGLAATWTLGSLLSGPLHLGHILRGGTLRRPIITPIVAGLLLAALFVLGAFVIRTIPALASLTEDVLGYARLGNLLDHFGDHPCQRHR